MTSELVLVSPSLESLGALSVRFRCGRLIRCRHCLLALFDFLLCFLCGYVFPVRCGVIIVVVLYMYRFCGGGGDIILLVSVVLMAGGLPAATDGYVPSDFVGWDVGLVCRVLCLLAFSVSFICACLWRFESYLFAICTFFLSL